MSKRHASTHARLMCGAAGAALLLWAGSAQAQTQTSAQVEIAPQSLASALNEFGVQTGYQVIFAPTLTGAKKSPGVTASGDIELALSRLLDGSGLTFRRDDDTFLIVRADAAPQSSGAAGNGAEVEALIVTAQKREEDIQDVPIAISAFTQEDLTRSQVAGGPDLMTQVPNMTFTKTNFSSYSIQIRGIGTQAISATTDAAVAVAFNNTPFIRNRFFEQEFYDLARIEVLRGPQGTLYGRNATAGVVNIISAKPTFSYEARASADIGNFSSTRLEGMINLPLVEDAVALRVAGAWTKRDGYAENQLTGNPIDGRDLWSSRVSLRFEPSSGIRADLIWEHFEEEDDRLRSGKQLCKTHEIFEVAGRPVGQFDNLMNGAGIGGMYPSIVFSQGCAPASLYSMSESFQTPNGLSLPYYYPLRFIGLPVAMTDPYVSRTQSQNLRVIESAIDPEYDAKTDLAELQISIDLTDTLTLASETSYLADSVFSMQDYNRFNTQSGAWLPTADRPGVLNNGVFCDPQLGCSDRMMAVDVSTARSRQFSQEFRLSSDFSSGFNFSVGANFLRYDTEDKYYVFINSLSLYSTLANRGRTMSHLSEPYVPGVTDNSYCLANGMIPPDHRKIQEIGLCTYMDPNPIKSLNDRGHNYFLSKNPYKLISYAVFGESYIDLAKNLKLTAGMRWTVDRKEAPRVPSWVLAADSVGYPVVEVVRQQWREPTGRATVDWRPDLAFTDETMIYASLSRGYKAGGANPPPTGPVAYCSLCGDNEGVAEEIVSRTHPKIFDPEFINALEVGSKNTFLDGRATLNLTGFYYDYEGYQISQIVNRSAVNLNFDAEVWGVEIEGEWRPVENLRLGFKGGYQNTRVADGESAIDLMDRTAGRDDWLVIRPFPTYTSNCILPRRLFEGVEPSTGQPVAIAVGGVTGGNPGGCELAYSLNFDPVTWLPYVPNPTEYAPGPDLLSYLPGYQGFDPSTAPNKGEGFDKELGGNELPNAPHFTATITADYTLPLPNDWLMTLHGDLYYQSEAWTRIFNMEGYDKLKAYSNINFAAIFTNANVGWKVMAYVKNILDRDSITGAFLNSDDTGLTTNVFLTEPRLYGVRVTKEWAGGPWWSGAGAGHPRGEPYPFTVELGGQVQRHAAPVSAITPSFVNVTPPPLSPVPFQDGALDWGDGREVRMTYVPAGGQIWFSGHVRYGKTNGSDSFNTFQSGGRSCIVSQNICEIYAPILGAEYIYFGVNNFTDAQVKRREEHTLIDFVVGREMGLGAFGADYKSAFQGGLRHARFTSNSRLGMIGVSDWDLPVDYAQAAPASHTRREVDLRSEREFAGSGPVLIWDAARRLFGDDQRGRLDLEWSLEAALLFGKQEVRFEGGEMATEFAGMKYGDSIGSTPTPPPNGRSRARTIPAFGAGLGLSYEVDRVKVSGGYRWERYVNVIDGGYAERDVEDRTLDGPYFKLAVGFGG